MLLFLNSPLPNTTLKITAKDFPLSAQGSFGLKAGLYLALAMENTRSVWPAVEYEYLGWEGFL